MVRRKPGCLLLLTVGRVGWWRGSPPPVPPPPPAPPHQQTRYRSHTEHCQQPSTRAHTCSSRLSPAHCLPSGWRVGRQCSRQNPAVFRLTVWIVQERWSAAVMGLSWGARTSTSSSASTWVHLLTLAGLVAAASGLSLAYPGYNRS